MTRLAAVAIWVSCAVCAVAACKQSADAPPAAAPMPTMPASEIKRGQDACKAYVDKVCACADSVPAMAKQCALAHALPDAIQVGLDVAASDDSTRRDVLQVHDSVRRIVKKCIEDIARLPAAGCP